MDGPNSEFWITVYEQHRRTLRLLVGTLLLLCVVSLIDGLQNVSRLGEKYQVAVDVILKEKRDRALQDEIRQYIGDRQFFPALPAAAPAEIQAADQAMTVDLETIPPLHRAFVRTYSAAASEDFRIGNQPVTLHSFVIAMLFGPLAVIVAMIWPLANIRRLHGRLAALAEPDGPVQQKLNSLFFSRVTTRYGHGWRSHVLLCMLGVFVLATATPFVFTATHSIVRPDLRLMLHADGRVAPLDVNPLVSHLVTEARTEDTVLILLIGFLTLLLCVVVARLALAVPHHADRPRGAGTEP